MINYLPTFPTPVNFDLPTIAGIVFDDHIPSASLRERIGFGG
ncbi:hypothetical protein [Echinicola strongylocentroti]|nr:hypothetical protein [Echinicola strongylocentroti]